jgi:hypothetical protein
MRQIISTIYLLLCVCIVTTSAQVTITQATFPRTAGFVDTVIIPLTTGVAIPTEGANQTWDYSALTTDFVEEIEYFDATSSTTFAGALNYHSDDLTFQGMVIPSLNYRKIDATGWYDIGRTNTDITYPLASITGNTVDSLRFVGGDYPYQGRINWLEFPVTYPNQWTGTFKEDVPLELTVGAFGLNKTPGSRLNTTTHVREVVGFGTLVVPKDDATTTAPMDVLLIKVVATRADSFFLAGLPAPGAITSAFQVTQGQSSTNTYYLFYKPGFGSPIMSLGLTSTGNVDYIAYRRGGAGAVSTNNVALTPVRAFPNPIASGGVMTLQAESTSDFEIIQFMDMNGRVIETKAIRANSDNEIQVQTPSNLPNGLYLYTIQKKDGSLIGNGKFLVK